MGPVPSRQPVDAALRREWPAELAPGGVSLTARPEPGPELRRPTGFLLADSSLLFGEGVVIFQSRSWPSPCFMAKSVSASAKRRGLLGPAASVPPACPAKPVGFLSAPDPRSDPATADTAPRSCSAGPGAFGACLCVHMCVCVCTPAYARVQHSVFEPSVVLTVWSLCDI